MIERSTSVECITEAGKCAAHSQRPWMRTSMQHKLSLLSYAASHALNLARYQVAIFVFMVRQSNTSPGPRSSYGGSTRG